MNGQQVRTPDGQVWTIHRPKAGGILLRREGAFRWITSIELAQLQPVDEPRAAA